jgi:hypothetical protein
MKQTSPLVVVFNFSAHQMNEQETLAERDKHLM